VELKIRDHNGSIKGLPEIMPHKGGDDMNSRILQKHLESRLIILVNVCAANQKQDDGLIYEILTDTHMDDQSRLNYIAQIECRLPQIRLMPCKNEWSLNSRYAEESEESDTAWQQVRAIAISTKGDEHGLDCLTCQKIAKALS